MPGLIPDSFIDDLLARVDIVDVIEHRVPLKKAGKEWMACCPFHNERSPSFSVSPSKQFYHCFGCGAHGSAIKFLMEYDRLEFPDAVDELAQTVGMQVPHEASRNAAPREDKTDLYTLLDAAANWYASELPHSAEAQAYCTKRGLDADTIARFRLGWAPSGYDGVIKALGRDERRMQQLTEAGMVARNDRGNSYDRFRERLMFPILDRRGRVIAFGGRILQEKPPHADTAADTPEPTATQGHSPKYLNSPETPLFHKGRELFALWQVKQANNHLVRIVVVEGYMDVIALHQAGLPIAVATLGTATTPEHTEVLFRAAPDVVFCFDGDRAGRAAAWKALDAALPRLRDGRQAYFLFLPDGEDPDSLVRKEGKAGFEQRIKAATPLSEYFFNELAHDVDISSLDGRARLAERARPLIAKLPDGAFRDLMGQELEKRSGARALQPGNSTDPRRPLERPGTHRSLVRSAITLLLAQPGLADQVEKPYAFVALEQPGVAVLAELLDLARARPGINPAMLAEHFAGRPEYAILEKLIVAHTAGDAETQAAEFHAALQRMQDQAVAQRRAALVSKSRSGVLDATEKAEMRQLLAARVPPTTPS